MTTEIIRIPASITAPTQFDTSILAGLVRDSTIKSYQRTFDAYSAFAGNWAAVIDPTTLAKWRTWLSGQSLSPNTINRKLTSIKKTMHVAAEHGYISHETALAFDQLDGVSISAMRDNLRKHSRTRITPEDMRRLCNAPNVSTLAGLMHSAFLHTLASSGLRIAEAITLTSAQIERKQEGYILLIRGKTDIEPREAPLSPEAYAAIQTWLQARPVTSEWIFTGFDGRGSRGPRTAHIHPVSAWGMVKRYAAQVGLEHIKPHDFRRFVGTQLAKSDPRHAQKALGHKNISTTYKHYVLDELPVGLTDHLY